jgi:hypothetical protein
MHTGAVLREYLELQGQNEQETGKYYILRSFMIYRVTKKCTTNQQKVKLHHNTKNKYCQNVGF